MIPNLESAYAINFFNRHWLRPFLVCLWLYCPLALAQVSEPVTEAAEQSTLPEANSGVDPEANKDKPAPAPAIGKTKKTNSEIFLPSEEISEDFAVSFPVDI